MLAVVGLFAACSAPEHATAGTSAIAEANAAFERGLERIKAQDPGGAIEDLTRSIELDPTRAMAFNWRGHCFNLLEYYDDAIRDYDRAIELGPQYAWSHYARAMSNHNLRRYDEAIAGYTRAIELDPTVAKPWRWRGFTRKLVGNYADAERDLAHAMQLPHEPTWTPDEDVWTLKELAKVRQALAQLRECERALQSALEIDVESADAWAQLGFLATVEGRTDLALERFARASALANDSQPRIWTYAVRALRGDERAALADDLRAWSNDARIQDPWELQVVAFLLGEGDDAQLASSARSETEFRTARGMPPDYLLVEARFHAGLRHELRGEIDLARESYRAARAEPAPESWEWSWADVRLRALERPR